MTDFSIIVEGKPGMACPVASSRASLKEYCQPPITSLLPSVNVFRSTVPSPWRRGHLDKDTLTMPIKMTVAEKVAAAAAKIEAKAEAAKAKADAKRAEADAKKAEVKAVADAKKVEAAKAKADAKATADAKKAEAAKAKADAKKINLPAMEELANKIRVTIVRSDDLYITAGEHLKEAQKRVAAGEAGEGVTWKDWLKQHNIGEEKARIVLQIANSDDTAAAVAAHRKAQAERQKKSRDNKKQPVTISRDVTGAGIAPAWSEKQSSDGAVPPAPPAPVPALTWMDRFIELWTGEDAEHPAALKMLVEDHRSEIQGLLNAPALAPAKRRSKVEPDAWAAESAAKRAEVAGA